MLEVTAILHIYNFTHYKPVIISIYDFTCYKSNTTVQYSFIRYKNKNTQTTRDYAMQQLGTLLYDSNHLGTAPD